MLVSRERRKKSYCNIKIKLFPEIKNSRGEKNGFLEEKVLKEEKDIPREFFFRKKKQEFLRNKKVFPEKRGFPSREKNGFTREKNIIFFLKKRWVF